MAGSSRQEIDQRSKRENVRCRCTGATSGPKTARHGVVQFGEDI
jgi:hypothetical protein